MMVLKHTYTHIHPYTHTYIHTHTYIYTLSVTYSYLFAYIYTALGFSKFNGLGKEHHTNKIINSTV